MFARIEKNRIDIEDLRDALIKPRFGGKVLSPDELGDVPPNEDEIAFDKLDDNPDTGFYLSEDELICFDIDRDYYEEFKGYVKEHSDYIDRGVEFIDDESVVCTNGKNTTNIHDRIHDTIYFDDRQDISISKETKMALSYVMRIFELRKPEGW